MHKHHEYKLIIDQKHHEWPRDEINGRQIKELAGVPQSYRVWQDLPGPHDPPVGDDQEVHLRKHEVERFFTGENNSTEGSS